MFLIIQSIIGFITTIVGLVFKLKIEAEVCLLQFLSQNEGSFCWWDRSLEIRSSRLLPNLEKFSRCIVSQLQNSTTIL